MHLFNANSEERIDLIHRGQYICLYYLQYPAVKINKSELLENINGKMDICVDIETEKVTYKPKRFRTEATIILCTPDSYTDSEPYGTMTLLYFMVTENMIQYLCSV